MHRILLLVLFLLSCPLMADRWSFPAELKQQNFVLGDLTIERTIDTRKNQQFPLYQVKVFRRGEELYSYIPVAIEI